MNEQKTNEEYICEMNQLFAKMPDYMLRYFYIIVMDSIDEIPN